MRFIINNQERDLQWLKNRRIVCTCIHTNSFFLMKYQNQRGRHVDRQTEGPKKREKKYIKLYMLSSISTTVSKHSKFRKALIPPETQSEVGS